MKLLFILGIIFFAIFGLGHCQIQTFKNAVHKDHPGKCYLPTNPPTILSPGDTVTVAGKCERAVCDRKFNIEIHPCPNMPNPKKCTKTDNAPNRPYPECCPKFKCT